MSNALIGYTGFVGSSLLRQADFESLYRSTNISEIRNKVFETVVCAGAPGQKWLANKNPEDDSNNIQNLISQLKTIKCDTFILISTVDVFSNPICVDENTVVDETNLGAYGLNRYKLEKFVSNHFSNYLIIRLPGLVGPFLRKNIIFDLSNFNNLNLIESRNVYQFYPIVNLWFDIQICLKEKFNLVHLTAEPISVASLSLFGFGKEFSQQIDSILVNYDFRTIYAKHFNSNGSYQYLFKDTIQAIRTYAQSEKITL